MRLLIPYLSYENPVHSSLVHKQSKSEVFPTDIVTVGLNEMWVGVRWPKDNLFYKAVPSPRDSYLLLETIRQITILVCHDHYGVPAGSHFIMNALGMCLTRAITTAFEASPFENISVHIHGTNLRRSAGGGLHSIRLEAELCSNGRPFAAGHGDAMIANDGVYSRIRGGRIEAHHDGRPRRLDATVSARSVGHLSESDVVVGEVCGGYSYRLSLDFSNSTLFDHPLDHVSGMIPVEACRQIIRIRLVNPEAELEEAEFHFSKALEYEAPVVATVEDSGPKTIVRFVQSGEVAVTATLRALSLPKGIRS